MGHQLGIAGGAGGEEHHHGVAAAGRVRLPVEGAGKQHGFPIIIVPAFPLAAAQHQGLYPGAIGQGFLHLFRGMAIGAAHHSPDIRRLEAVFKILLQQLIRGWHRHCAQLMQAQDGKPELIVPPEHQHDPVSPLDSQGFEIVGGPGGLQLHVLEGEPPLFLVVVQVEHRQLIRLFPSQPVHDIKGEVKGFLVFKGDLGEGAGLVLRGVDEVLIDETSCGGSGPDSLRDRFLLGLLPRQDHGQEGTIRPIHGDHAMGRGTIIIDAVPFREDFLIIPYPHLQLAGKHQVKFLPIVGGGMDGLILLGRIIRIGYPIGLRDLIPEKGRHIFDLDALFLGRSLSLAPAGHRIGG